MIANLCIRRRARAEGIPLWRVAIALGVSEATLTRKLRVELSEDERQRIESVIDELAGGEEQ